MTSELCSSTAALDSSCDSNPQDTRTSHISTNKSKTPLSSLSSKSTGQKQYILLATTDVALPFSSKTTINRSTNSLHRFPYSQNSSVVLQSKPFPNSQLTRKLAIGIPRKKATLDLFMYSPHSWIPGRLVNLWVFIRSQMTRWHNSPYPWKA